ncbi:MAG: DUF2934 domain-containing protein [Rickettsiales bacterium]|jgi:cobalamin biosynthesis Mg chelatase CobN|nr:DUF2934 domain-containing protein [Rickettsiales bacterium]
MHNKNEYIRTAAYYIWLDEGCPDGRDAEIWNEAERRYELAHMKPVCTKKECGAPAVARRAVFIVAKPAGPKTTREDVEAAFGVKKKPTPKPAKKKAAPAPGRQPAKKAPTVKAAAKKPATQKTAAKKPALKKPAANPASKNITPRPALLKKAAALKPVVKKSIVVKMAPKKPSDKK